jgi:hypothetical protein
MSNHIAKMQMDQDDIRWLRATDIKFSTSMIMLAQSKMRNQAIHALSKWDGASTCVFGGSIRRTILSEHTIKNDEDGKLSGVK